MKLVLVAALCITLAGVAWSAEPWAATAPFEKAQALEAMEIVNASKAVKKEIVFAATPRRVGMLTVLRFSAYVAAEGDRTYAHALALEINKRSVKSRTRKRARRLINRASTTRYKVKSERRVAMWGRSFARSTALLLFTGETTEPPKEWLSDREELAWYVVDVTDLVKRPKDVSQKLRPKANTLVLTNCLLKRRVGGKSYPIVIEDLALGYLPIEAAKAQIAAKSLLKKSGKKPTHADGTYKDRKRVKGFTCELAVTFKQDRMTEIKVLKLTDKKRGQRARRLVDAVLKAQSTKVDTVTGATYSCRALLQAVDGARAKARAAAKKK